MKTFTLGAALVVAAVSAEARAQSDAHRTATAAALYDQAVKAMASGDYAGACPRLEEVVKLEPDGVGARIALAECYEGAGKLESAWGAFLRAEAVAAKAKQAAQQKKAHARAGRLVPRLGHLRVTVPEAVAALPGLAIRRDDVDLAPGLWATDLPVDKGDHVVVVTATGRKPVEQRIHVADGESAVVEVDEPAEDDPPRPPPPLRPAPHRSAPPPEPEPPQGALVHIKSDDPSKPLKLYRIESEFAAVVPTFGYSAGVPMNGVGVMGGSTRTAYGAGVPTYGVGVMGGSTRTMVCVAPCDEDVAGRPGQEFFLDGAGITPSSRFTLPADGSVTIKASPGSSVALVFGVVLIVLGASTAVSGLAFIPLAVNNNASSGIDPGAAAAVAGGLAGGGLLLTGIGIPVLLNGRTTFSFDGRNVALRF